MRRTRLWRAFSPLSFHILYTYMDIVSREKERIDDVELCVAKCKCMRPAEK